MVVGESGLGKSTLINSLFLTDLYPGMYDIYYWPCIILITLLFKIISYSLDRVVPNAAEKIKKTVQLDASTVEIEERGVKLRLTGKIFKKIKNYSLEFKCSFDLLLRNLVKIKASMYLLWCP